MKSLKQFIWDKMEKGEYILDQDLASFVGKDKEVNFYTAECYKREYTAFNNDKNFFKDWETNPETIIAHYRRRYQISRGENKWYKISKNYYNYLKEKGIKCEKL